ncbi:MAG TPA: hypothetical protein VGQ76_14310 [Thermoanaerobaculia bacterium]|jgi:hypothetical protein|nr:hypothetical protein [Thermoanaerobaculia bacterium]
MTHRQFVVFVAASTGFMALILLSDRKGLVPQLLLGGATAAFLVYFARRSSIDRRQIICAIVIATVGEVVLSLGWKLYSYSHAVIPLYVPPGHGLFYLLAAETSMQSGVRRHARAISRVVLIGGSVIAIGSLIVFGDTWGFLWWVGALALLRFSSNRLLLAACFSYTILLELAGTANGNWQWAAIVPYVGLQSANPPAGVGILYIVLDLLVVFVSSRFMKPVPTSHTVSGREKGRSRILSDRPLVLSNNSPVSETLVE